MRSSEAILPLFEVILFQILLSTLTKSVVHIYLCTGKKISDQQVVIGGVSAEVPNLTHSELEVVFFVF